MILSDVSVRRPVLATVMSLMLVLIGVISYDRLSVREYPNIDSPTVSVRTVYRGASPEIIESQVTRPLEESLSGIEGVRTLKSISREEVSQITIEFNLDRNIDAAANDVRDRVARVRGRLPDATDDSIVAKIEADAQPVLWVAFFSDRHTPLEITDFADRFVKDRLQALSGVATIMIGGERRYAMRLWLDRDRLASFGLVATDLEDALRRQNVEIPSGRVEGRDREFTVLTETDLRTPEQFNDLIIREVNGYLVRLKDVGNAELGAADVRNRVRVNGEPAVGLGVVKQSNANTLAVAQAVKAELPVIQASLPEGMNLRVAFDSSLFIEKSIEAVYKTIFEALALVVLVIFAFLRSVRATLIPFVTIPVSLIGAFAVMHWLGYSINVLTLLALVLAIGLVVDDAIVMLENIYRRIERGVRPFDAALQGSKEIAFAVLAMTTTLAAVFLPLGFQTGNTGRLFTEFAWTVSGAVIISGFVALTLTPMMCSKLLRAKPGAPTTAASDHAPGWLQRVYQRGLLAALKVRWVVVLVAFAAAGAGIYLALLFPATKLKSELSPTEDRGFVIGIVLAPEGSTLDYTDEYARKIEAILSKVPEVRTYFMVVAPGLERPNPVTMAFSFVSLKPWEERERKQQQIAAELGGKFFGLAGVMAFPNNPPSLGQSFRASPVQFVIQGNSYGELQEILGKLMEKFRAYPGLANVDADLKLNKPQLKVEFNRDKAADLGVSAEDIGRTLETMFGGREVTRFRREGQQYDVIVQNREENRVTPKDLPAIYVRGTDGNLVPLSNLITYRESVAPKELNHFNRLRSATVTANVAPGYALGDVLAFMEQAAKEALPPTARVTYDGQSREFKESAQTMLVVFALALAFIYLVLAAQFESFIDPFIIMLTVPLGVVGALWGLKLMGIINGIAPWLKLTDGTLNVYSQIGLVMLVGLITKNGILIVEFANQLQEQGKSKLDAVVDAAGMRLRPILMTTLTMILAALPLAFAGGAGAESRQQIGWVIVGGLAIGTLLTLFVVPAVYTMLARRRQPSGATVAAAPSLS